MSPDAGLLLYENCRPSGAGRPYHRIPALLATRGGALLAACEARLGPSDYASVALALRRSADGGRSWSTVQRLWAGPVPARCIHNPTLIEAVDGRILLLYGTDYRRIWMRSSGDGGRSWSAPRELSAALRLRGPDGRPRRHRVVAVGPGHGSALPDGTLLATCWFADGGRRAHVPSAAALAIGRPRDDGDWDWTTSAGIWGENVTAEGEIAAERGGDWLSPNEGCLVPLGPDEVLVNLRHRGAAHCRWQGLSRRPFAHMGGALRTDLPDPACFGSLARAAGRLEGPLYFVNCAHPSAAQPQLDANARVMLRLRRSDDGGHSWSAGLLIAQRAGYADLAVSPDGATVYVLYEAQAEDGEGLAGLRFVRLAAPGP